MATKMKVADEIKKEIEEGKRGGGGGGDTVYGLGLIGAWVYYIGRAQTTEEKVKGFFKAFVWPAILVYKLLEFFEPRQLE